MADLISQKIIVNLQANMPQGINYSLLINREELMDIYKLTSPSGKVYIGKAKDANNRWKGHLANSKKEACKSHLCLAIKKYGFDSFKKEIIDFAETAEDLNIKEQFWISFFESNNKEKGYNCTKGGDGGDTWSYLTPEQKALAIAKRPPMSNETKLKLSVILTEKYKQVSHPSCGKPSWNSGLKSESIPWNKGQTYSTGPRSEETCRNISESLKGKQLSEEHKLRISNTLKGRIRTTESIEKSSKAHCGIPLSESHKKSISISCTGRVVSEETRKKQSESAIGREPWNKGLKTNKQSWNKGLVVGNSTHFKIKIKCLETDDIFNSIKEAAEKLDSSSSMISMQLSGKRKSANGFHFIKVEDN